MNPWVKFLKDTKGSFKSIQEAARAYHGNWTSSAGLYYGTGSVDGTRIRHVLCHGFPDRSKRVHGVFIGGPTKVLGIVDEAWRKRAMPRPGDPGAYLVRMGRVIGTAGEDKVKIIVVPGTNRLVTAYPQS